MKRVKISVPNLSREELWALMTSEWFDGYVLSWRIDGTVSEASGVSLGAVYRYSKDVECSKS